MMLQDFQNTLTRGINLLSYTLQTPVDKRVSAAESIRGDTVFSRNYFRFIIPPVWLNDNLQVVERKQDSTYCISSGPKCIRIKIILDHEMYVFNTSIHFVATAFDHVAKEGQTLKSLRWSPKS